MTRLLTVSALLSDPSQTYNDDQELEIKGNLCAQRRDREILSESLSRWMIQERGILLERVRENQIKEKVLNVWNGKYHKMKSSLDGELISVFSREY